MDASGGPPGHVAQSRRQRHAIDARKGQGAISKVNVLVRIRNGQIRHPPEILVVQLPDVLNVVAVLFLVATVAVHRGLGFCVGHYPVALSRPHDRASAASRLDAGSGPRPLCCAYTDPGATLDDLREAVNMIEDTQRIARRIFGRAHPLTKGIEYDRQVAQGALRAREATQPSGGT